MNNKSPLRLRALPAALSFACLSVPAHAQQAAGSEAELPTVVVTGNPLGSGDVVAPVSTLSGDGLTLRRASTLGETLNGLPGVSSTYFGPNSNRPIIRGLDGDRIRILSNSGASIDASSLSFDHAVPIDPLVVERVEVLRGPAALLYGGSATGGVVNTLDNRIPRAAIEGVNGNVEARLGGAEREKGGGALVEAGNGRFALHADVFGRDTEDLHVPRFTPIADGQALEPTTRIANSASEAKGGALGGSWTFDRGYLGASVDTYDNTYGVVVEPDVTIRMNRDRYALAGEVRELEGFLRTVRGQLSYTDYHHEEVEGSGEIGTAFKSEGTDGRLELEHAPIGTVRGVLGFQFEDSKFSALGEEAFVPSTKTRNQALFLVEELPTGFGKLNAGARIEHAKLKSEGDSDPDEAQFGPPSERSFTPKSASIGALVKLGASWQMTGSLSYTERAPTFYELFANGVHVATGTFEVGDPNQDKERGNNLDLALQWKEGPHSFKVGAYNSRFSNYIALQGTGQSVSEVDEEGNVEEVPVFAFQGVKARLYGLELEGRRRLVDTGYTLDLDGRFDLVRGTNRSTGDPLPRIAPARLTVGLDFALAGWSARAEVEHAARQSRVSPDDISTDSYTLLNMSAGYKFKAGPTDAFLFAKLTNLTDELAFNASSIRTVRELAPLPGRAIEVGMRVGF